MRIISLVTAYLMVACNTGGGDGIGTPPFKQRAMGVVDSLIIRQIYTGDPNLTGNPNAVQSGQNPNAFVQLSNDGNQTVIFTQPPLLLVAQSGRVDLSPLPPLPPGGRVTVDASPLHLHWAAGEVAVVDSSFNIQTYLAWGNPRAFVPSYLRDFGIEPAQSGFFVAVPFINANNQAIAYDPNATDPNTFNVGCVAVDPQRSTNSPAPTPCPHNPNVPAAQISEVAPAWPDGSGNWVEIVNMSNGPIDLYGLLLCNQGQCTMVDQSVPIATPVSRESATSTARVQLFMAAPTQALNQAGQFAINGALPLGVRDEVALLPPGAFDPSEPNSIGAVWSYLRYANVETAGNTSEPLPATFFSGAQAANLWDSPTTTLRAVRMPGDSLSLNPNTPATPTAWQVAQASPLLPNALVDVANPSTWTACSFPLSDPPASLVIASIALSGHTAITLANLDTAAHDLNGLQIANPNGTFGLTAYVLPAGQSVTVELQSGTGPCAATSTFCWQSSQATLDAGEISLLDHTGAVLHHVQWGPPALQSVRGPAAQAARVWPNPRCRIDTTAGNDIVLGVGAPGHSPRDYSLNP